MKRINELILAAGLLAALPATAEQTPIDFDRQIRPIISDKCYFCHGQDREAVEGKLQLHTFDLATSDRDGRGAALVPGKPEDSLLWQHISSTDPEEVMPPPKRHAKITKAEAAIIHRWITEGAEYSELWSFRKLPLQIAVPAKAHASAKNKLDHFIQQGLVQEGLTPSGDAEPEMLLRRLYLNLTGLVPTPARIAAFKTDTSGKAYENTVDQLLASKAFAEHLAVDWMDVARYADSYGYQVDRGRTVWPWRDWALKAFESNMPYDQFILHQLAGDLIPEADDQSRLATAFNRLHGMKVEGGSVPEEFRTEYVADRAQTAGTAFLGLTMECCRCHDHKYDPISMKDYYRTFALFNNIDEAGLLAYFDTSVPSPTLIMTNDAEKVELAKRKAEVAQALAGYNQVQKTEQPAFAEWRKSWDGKVNIPGLLAYYSFDELEGGKIPNLAGRDDKPAANPLTLGSNQQVDGISGKGVLFDGDTKVVVGQIGPFARHAPFSISAAIEVPIQHKRAIILHRSQAWTDAASRGYELLIHDGKLDVALVHFSPGDEIRVRTVEDVPLNTWTRIAMTYDGSGQAAGIRLYVNGELARTDIIRDHLTKEIRYRGKRSIELAARMRDKGFKHSKLDDLAIYNRALTALEVRAERRTDVKPADEAELFDFYLATRSDAAAAARAQLMAKRTAYNQYLDGRSRMMVMKELQPRRRTFVLKRGHYSDPDPDQEVEPGPPEKIFPFGPEYSRDRLGFAKWLVHPEHPLTARVAVNRYWQQLFGEGIVTTSNDFGFQGALPSHPELLDYLARTFIDSGWDVRHLFKYIVMSHTFRQDSSGSAELLHKDPDNKLLARGPSRHMTAEMLRDSSMLAGDWLNPQFGGGSTGLTSNRRSMYVSLKRSNPSPELLIFGSPRRMVCSVKREKTSTPLQPLVLMNSPQYTKNACMVAMVVLKEKQSDAVLLEQLFLRLASRSPSPDERTVLMEMLNEQRSYFKTAPKVTAALLKAGGGSAPKGTPPEELAAWTVLANAVMNLDSFYMVR